ncbi:divergent polysaccharide deacetylase family protein [Pseudooceanicola algae]|uniref:Divergent polysaccharide deacetylase n=1 Tax=Pseudooceanicola algae TaxID=1537215 RepID=A0A7T1BSW9_9RHOB|nr:divergent polysaccharide deacetylase family protein [Pseudooceanicola algae]QPM89840.1 hypothetical protein PSAL_010690 [Pseudooceanicola algae]
MLRGILTGGVTGILAAIGLIWLAGALIPSPQIGGHTEAVAEAPVVAPEAEAEPAPQPEAPDVETPEVAAPVAAPAEARTPGVEGPAADIPEADTPETEAPASVVPTVPELVPETPEADAPEAPEPPASEATDTLPEPPQTGPTVPLPAPAPGANGLVRPEIQPDTPTLPTPEGGAALERNAQPFDAGDSRPRLAVVLIDDGTATPALLNRVRDFPHPLSIALDPAAPGAAAAMAQYRAAGFEVLARPATVPDAASAPDLTADWISALPGSLALLEPAPGALQQGSAAAQDLAGALAQQGYGLVLYPEGEDVTRKIAERRGVPAATLFREFDGKGEDRTLMRRFLDFGANLARPGAGVVMLGHLRPETLSALVVWGLTDKADTVALVPVSAVLTEGSGS